MIGFDIYTYKQLRRLDRIRLNVNGQGDARALHAVLPFSPCSLQSSTYISEIGERTIAVLRRT